MSGAHVVAEDSERANEILALELAHFHQCNVFYLELVQACSIWNWQNIWR
jgi:hypothetical protein